ncbi:RNA polymerase sigma factor SigB [Camelliibacillus cellulosilyticus]|uniref:RNA polymerase sigma factor SigB n=2 Tax=Camelliibacillus cellulosilyticus TaxID=2174486 RepID=A0ABV9GKP9_9BACL
MNKQSSDETASLIRELQMNPENAALKAQLVERYTDLVHSLARKFAKNTAVFDDLSQVGMVGLLSAFDRFDATLGKSFEAFAVPTIVGEIKRYIRDKTWSVHVPRRIKELGPKIKRTVDVLTNELGHSPTVKEIADYLMVDEEEVLETMELSRSYQAVSVDSQIEADADGGTVTLLDIVGQKDDGFDKVDKKMLLEKAFSVLSEREKAILVHVYFDNLSQKETGERLGLSQMHVSRLQRRALRKLRETLTVGEESEVL